MTCCSSGRYGTNVASIGLSQRPPVQFWSLRTTAVRNEARVHLWYEDHFGVPAGPFASTRNAVDHFASTTCCFALTADKANGIEVYAPHGYDDLFAQRLRPNPVLAPREVYDAKAARWQAEWPRLSIEPWPG